tara:strand:- start:1602 stop:3998 length:2397 start_codon:yes stop_codon:yes gene_type:complete
MIAMKKMKQSIIAVALLTAVTACGSAEESADKFIESGMALMSEGEYDKARLEFRNAIQINPTEAEPYYQLSLIDEKKQNWKEMYANLRAAQSLDPDNPKIILKLGQIEVVSGQIQEALDSAEKVLAIEPDNIDAILLRANARMKQENFGQAQKDIDKALEIDESSLDALSYQVMIYKEARKYPEALNAAEKALAIHPEAMPIKMIQLAIYDEQKNYQKMESLYREIMLDYPDESWVVFSLVKLLNDGLNRHEDAKSELVKYINANENDTEAKLVYIKLLDSQDADGAIDQLDKYIQQEPENIEFRFARVEMLIQQGKSTEAVDDLKEIIKADASSEIGLRAQVNLASIEASKENFAEAEKIVDNVLVASAENEMALLLKSKIQLRQGAYDAAISNLRIIVRNNPNADEALVLLAQAYANSGSPELAQSSFRQALSVNAKNVQAALSVAQSMIRDNDLDRAETVLMNALRGNPENQDLLQALAQVRMRKQDWAGTGETLKNLDGLGTVSAVNHLLSAQMYQGLEDQTLAIVEFEKALELNPGLNPALQGLVAAHMQLEQKDAVVNYLQQHISDHPELINGYAALASVYRETGDSEQALETLEQGISQHPDWIESYRFIADIHARQNNPEKVIEAFKRGLDANPENNILSMQLASSYEAAGDFELARQLYENVIARDPSADIAANNLASLLSEQFESPENLQRALTLASRFRDSQQPYFADTFGWINYKLGNYQDARPALERAASSDDAIALFHYHLGRLYVAMEMPEKARSSFETAQVMANDQNDNDLIGKISEQLNQM